jgi:hypothetical protein
MTTLKKSGIIRTLALLTTLLISGLARPAAGQCDPVIFGAVDTPDFALGVAVSGGTAYIADQLSGLQVFDVSDPANPTFLGSVVTPGLASDVAISGTVAFVADAASGLQAIDVSDPTNPMIIGSVLTPDDARRVVISGTLAYVAAGDTGGLQVIDVFDPTTPVILGGVDTPGFALGVAVSGTTAYIADNLSGLQVLDVSTPATPTIVGTVNTPGSAADVIVAGTVAYVADFGSGLQVIDVSVPATPAIIGSVATPTNTRRLAVAGTVVYITDESPSLEVIDVSNPASPAIIGSAAMPSGPQDIDVSGAWAYVADSASGLQVVDRGVACLLGACCVQGACVELIPEESCLAIGGSFLGAGATCAASDCSNDWCGGAVPIALGDTAFSTIGASTSGPINVGCDLGDGTRFTNEIWYEYLALSDGTLTVSTCGQATYDTIIAAYTGACGSLNLVACDDQGCAPQSIINFPVIAGQAYRLRVGGWAGSTGTGVLTLTMLSCDADITGPADGPPDGSVDVLDLLMLLADWGLCP